MEITLQSPQSGTDVSDCELLEEQNQIRIREDTFRIVLARVVTVIFFLASSMLVYQYVPFYPLPMSIFLALLSAGIASRWPAVALAVMLLFTAPAYCYQLGVTLWALSVPVTIAIVLPLALSGLPGACIGAAIGAAAGALMLTPYFWLSLPLIAVVTLLRLKGSPSASGWALFMFLAFYLPFLFLLETPVGQSESIPLFTQVEYLHPSALANLDLSSFKTAFEGLWNNDTSGAPGFSNYFIDEWGGVVLVLTLFASILVTPAVFNLSRRIQRGGVFIKGLMPLLLLLSVEMIFLVPLLLLGDSLGYHTGFDEWNNIAIMTGIMVGIGLFTFAAETWLRRRDLKLTLTGSLTALSIEIYGLLDKVRSQVHQVGYLCRRNNFVDEKAIISQYEDKVALTMEGVNTLALPRLETSNKEFCDMKLQLGKVEYQLENKLIKNLDECKRLYESTVNEALKLGIPDVQNAIQSWPLQTDLNDYDSALKEQEQINSAFQDLAVKLIAAGDMVANTIKDEMDPEFSLTTIDIAHGFLNQGRFEEAAQTISEDLQIIDGRIENSIANLARTVISLVDNFKDSLISGVIPVFESIGDPDSLDKYRTSLAEIDDVSSVVRGSETLADIIAIVEQSRKLSDITTTIAWDLNRRIKDIEVANDRICPAKYSWGKNNYALGEIKQILDSIEEKRAEATISSRFTIIEKAIQAVRELAKTIKQYSRMNEFLINYANIEYLLKEELKLISTLTGSALPVKRKYAIEYLKMYAAKNHDEVSYDQKTGSINLITAG